MQETLVDKLVGKCAAVLYFKDLHRRNINAPFLYAI